MSGALSAGTVSLGVKPDTAGLGAKLSAGILGETSGLGQLGKDLGGKLLAGLGAVGIAVGVGEFIKTGVEEYSKADALNAQFAAGIKSTNNAAGLSVKGMDELAASVSGYSGQAYDSIGKTEQVLQTFTNLKNVGPNKIFDEATVAASNMAAKLGGDASAQAIQLGKALNDPVKGMTALRRVGVAFTQSQTDQVKAMVASGNVMGAQKVILGELNTEFGGAAKAAGQTLPGEIARSKVAFGELTKAVVSGVMPFVTPVIEGIANAMVAATPFVEKFTDVFKEKLSPVVKAISGAFQDFFSGFTKGTDALGSSQSIFAAWGAVAFGVFEKIKPLFDAVKPALEGMWASFKPVLASIGAAFEKLWPSIQPLIPQVMALATALSPLHLIFTAIAPVLPALIGTFGQLSATLDGALGGALKEILPVMTQVAGMIAGELASVVKMIIPIILQLVSAVGPILGEVLKAVVPLLAIVASFVGQLMQAVMPLVPVVLSLVMAFLPLLTPLIQLIGSILQPLIQLLTAVLVPVMALDTGLVKFLVPAVNLIIQVITWLITNAIAGAKIEFTQLGSVISTIGSVVGNVFGAIGGVIKGAFNGVVDFVRGVVNTISGLINGIIDGINGVTGLGAAIGIHIGKIPHLPKLEHGGTLVRPGAVLVGEKGPEILNLPQAASVIPLDRAKTNTNASGAAEPTGPTDLSDSTIEKLARTLATYTRVQVRQGGVL